MIIPDLLFQVEIVKQLPVVGTLNPDHDLLLAAFFMIKLSHSGYLLSTIYRYDFTFYFQLLFDLGNSPLRPDP